MTLKCPFLPGVSPWKKLTDISNKTRRDYYSDFQSSAHKTHNFYRRAHGLGDLLMCRRLCKLAESHAVWLAACEDFEHSSNDERKHADGICGENLAETIVWHEDYRPITGEDITKVWYEEGSNYDYDQGNYEATAAQFTQVVWKDTRLFGIACVEYQPSDNPGFVKTIVVANYFPGGNRDNEFKENVLPVITLEKQSTLMKSMVTYDKNRQKEQFHRRWPLLVKRRSDTLIPKRNRFVDQSKEGFMEHKQWELERVRTNLEGLELKIAIGSEVGNPNTP